MINLAVGLLMMVIGFVLLTIGGYKAKDGWDQWNTEKMIESESVEPEKPSKKNQTTPEHAAVYPNRNVDVIELTKKIFQEIGIEYDEVVSTGGKTGVRVWVSNDISEDTLNLVHEKIVTYLNRPVALDIRDYKTDEGKYTKSRPKSLRGN